MTSLGQSLNICYSLVFIYILLYKNFKSLRHCKVDKRDRFTVETTINSFCWNCCQMYVVIMNNSITACIYCIISEDSVPVYKLLDPPLYLRSTRRHPSSYHRRPSMGCPPGIWYIHRSSFSSGVLCLYSWCTFLDKNQFHQISIAYNYLYWNIGSTLQWNS